MKTLLSFTLFILLGMLSHAYADVDITSAASQIEAADSSLVEKLTNKADDGDDEAQYQLGMLYYHGKVDPVAFSKDPNKYQLKAFELMSKAATQHYGNASLRLGHFYAYGIGTAIDVQKAYEWYEQAIKDGNMEAYVPLANFYLNGVIVKRDTNKAREYYQKAADADVLEGYLGLINYFNVMKIVKSEQEQFQKIKSDGMKLAHELADDGDPRAIILLGGAYYYGFGEEKNLEKAEKLFLQAAKAGEPIGQLMLAQTYRTDTKDNVAAMQQALPWYYQAAIRKAPAAYSILGRAYEFGIGINKNPELANAWYKKTFDTDMVYANAGAARSQERLANNYLMGLGVKRNYEDAIKWFKIAAENGSDAAKMRLEDLELIKHYTQ